VEDDEGVAGPVTGLRGGRRQEKAASFGWRLPL
jgi:hypothetical protein